MQYKRVFLSILALAILLGIGSMVISAKNDACADTKPRIAVISAFDAELTNLHDNMQIEKTCSVNGVEFYIGTLANHDVVAFLSGGSMVNAAMNPQLALDRFNITKIVYSGIAGGVNPNLHIGDVAIASQWAQYQEALYAREVDGKFIPPSWMGTLPYPNFGMSFPMPISVRTTAHPEGEQVKWLPVDQDMLKIAEKVATSVELAQCTADNICLQEAPRVVVGGNGVSGQTFVDNAEYRKYVYSTFQANVLDMETASTATVAYVNRVPFIAFRSLSDLAGGGPGENEIGTFFQVAADNSAKVVLKFLSQLPA